jgi:hypothetical protein
VKLFVLAAALLTLNAGCELMRPGMRGDFLLRVGDEGVMLSNQTAELDVSLPEKQIGDVQLGQPASVKPGGIKVAGTVTRN